MRRPFDGDTRITLRETDGGRGRKNKKKTAAAGASAASALSELIAAAGGEGRI